MPLTLLAPRRRARSLSLVVAAFASAGGCSPQPVSEALGDAGDATVPIRVQDAGPVPPLGAASCDAGPCEAPVSSPLLPIACCTEDGTCGMTTLLARDVCLEPGRPGELDSACPFVDLPGGLRLEGCCAPDQVCGIFDPVSSLGCLPGRQLGLAPVLCAHAADGGPADGAVDATVDDAHSQDASFD